MFAISLLLSGPIDAHDVLFDLATEKEAALRSAAYKGYSDQVEELMKQLPNGGVTATDDKCAICTVDWRLTCCVSAEIF